MFFRLLGHEMKKFDFYPIVCWDAGLAQRRLDAYPNYKRHLDRLIEANGRLDIEGKSEEPDEYLEEYRRQRGEIIKILDKLGVPSLRFHGWEGDDLMKLVTMMAEESIVVTDDRDLMQLLGDKISIRRALNDEIIAGRGHENELWYTSLGGNTKCRTMQEYFDKNGYEDIFEMVMVKAIVGDGSDNIPAVTAGLERKFGVGDTRAKVIAKVIYHNPKNYMEILKEMAENPKHLRDVYGKLPVNPIKGFLQRQADFMRNMELVDLGRVEFPDDIKIQVAQEIVSSVGRTDYFGTLALLGDHQINNIETDAIVGKLNMLSMSAIS
ncbi:RNaseH [Bacillus phage SP-15]|uniref:RNaseH n=1 Tax=Bacillus phage SP-15 TaxID=1792032 RepID=A0A127AWE4_9CAUD|nr:RNaseH [Bacillus phage SP-15]AMM44903.1 RNaseH [Bacillus phage SP-15]